MEITVRELNGRQSKKRYKELLSALKLREKISAIKKYIDSLKGDK